MLLSRSNPWQFARSKAGWAGWCGSLPTSPPASTVMLVGGTSQALDMPSDDSCQPTGKETWQPGFRRPRKCSSSSPDITRHSIDKLFPGLNLACPRSFSHSLDMPLLMNHRRAIIKSYIQVNVQCSVTKVCINIQWAPSGIFIVLLTLWHPAVIIFTCAPSALRALA